MEKEEKFGKWKKRRGKVKEGKERKEVREEDKNDAELRSRREQKGIIGKRE